MSKILIIGAGWYGCHIGLILKHHNIDFEIYEKNSDIFTQSSFKNQNRLHLGFHYARSYKTRKLCKEGYDKFIKYYKNICIKKLDNNYYCVANESIIDIETYKIIMKQMKLNIKDCTIDEIKNIQGSIIVDEMFIENYKIKQYFKKELSSFIKLSTEIDNNFIDENKHKYKYILNCTNNCLNTNKKFYFEKTLSLVYKKLNNNKVNGYTFVDGELCSLYPYDIKNKLYTLTDVKYTPLFRSYNYDEIKAFEINDLEYRKTQMENKFCKYYSNFKNDYKYVDNFISLKIKKESKSDERDCYINKNGNVINVFCDKILGIFIFEDYIKNLLNLFIED